MPASTLFRTPRCVPAYSTDGARGSRDAGARSVLASLWKVGDKSTAARMKRFYTYLKAGKAKDEALPLAQIDLIRSSEFAGPADWAAFQLNGDWK